MKKILLLLLFNCILLTSYGQWKNAYASSLKLINADSTHGELDGTEYRNAAGKYRYKENGTWKYRLSTTDAAAAFWPLSGDASMTSDVTINTDGHLFQIEGDDSYFNIANFGFELIHNSTTGVYTSGTGLNIQNVSGDINLVTDGATDRDIIFNMGTGSMIIPDAVANDDALTQILARDGTTGEIKYRDVSSISGGGGGITNSAAANELMKSDGTNAVGSIIYQLSSGSGATIGINNTAPDKKLDVNISTATTNIVGYAIRTSIESSGTPAAGIGVGMDFEVETAAGNNEVTGSIESVTTLVTPGNEYADLVFKAMGQGTLAESFRIAQLAGPTTRMSAQGSSVDATSSGWQMNGNFTATGSMKIGLQESSVIDRKLHVEEYGAGTNTVLFPFRMTRAVQSGNGATGIGVGMEFETELSDGTNVIGNRIESVTTDATAGSGDFDLRFYNMAGGAGAAETFRLTSVGNATLAGTGTGVDWVATSDRRLKYNFKPVGSQLYKIHQIANLVTNYDRKDNGKNETGFVAQELMNVAPEYVNAPVDTAAAYYSVNYSKLVVPLYKGVDELNDEVQALRNEVAELKQIVKEYRRMTYEMSKNLEASSK